MIRILKWALNVHICAAERTLGSNVGNQLKAQQMEAEEQLPLTCALEM